MHQCIKFILFWNDILHLSDGVSLHHQEFNTVHKATGMFDKRVLLYVQSRTPDGRKDRPKHAECHSKIK